MRRHQDPQQQQQQQQQQPRSAAVPHVEQKLGAWTPCPAHAEPGLLIWHLGKGES